jgi:hypothetical protein
MSEDNQSLLSDVLDFLNSDPNLFRATERNLLICLIERCRTRLPLEKKLTLPLEDSETTKLLTDILGFLETLRDDPNVGYFELNRGKTSLAKRCCEAQR